MTLIKVKDSQISSDWGVVVSESRNYVTVEWNGVFGIYTKDKNEFEYKEQDDDNRPAT